MPRINESLEDKELLTVAASCFGDWFSVGNFTAIAAIAAAVSAFLAWRSLANQKKERQEINARRENERLLLHATTTLERSFFALMSDSTALPSPPQDRLAWLTAARLIEEFKATKADITTHSCCVNWRAMRSTGADSSI